MITMFLVEFEGFLLRRERRATDDEITDLIEMIVDDLDRSGVEPSLSTARDGDDVRIDVSLHIDEHDEFDAWAAALPLVKAAFHAAGISATALVAPPAVRARATSLQPA